MSDKPDLKLSRIENPFFYSKDLATAIEEFTTDISKYFTAGYTYDEVLNNEKLLDVNKQLFFHFEKSNEHFPYLNRFVDYVYTRDEVKNPFGKWYTFNYFEPLQILEFANKLKAENSEIILRELASFIFLMFQYQNISTFEEIKRTRRKLINFKELHSDTWSENQRKVFTNLRKSNIYANRTTFIKNPDWLYRQIGFKGYRQPKKNAEFLGLDFAHYKINIDGYSSILLIHGIDALKEKFDNFLQSQSKVYATLSHKMKNILKSGIILPTKTKEQIEFLYENTLIRDRNRFLYKQHLESNPIVRISNFGNKYYCSIQSAFYDIKFVLASLYLVPAGKRKKIKDPLSKYLSDKSEELIYSCGQEYDIKKNNTPAFSYRMQLNNITTPLDPGKSIHTQQIEKSKKLIKQISDNGILVNIESAMILREKLKEKRKSREDIEDEEVIDYHYGVDQINEDDEIFGIEREKSIEQKIQELDNIILTNEHAKPVDNGTRRIHGTFTSHGAATHRLTCTKINLQGISKNVRKQIFMAPKGRVLISADVAGQDITVAANMAKNLFENPHLFKNVEKEKFQELHEKITETLKKLTDTTTSDHKPIDFITDNIQSNGSPLLEGMSRDAIRDIVKEAVYTLFYGGGQRTFLNRELKLKDFNELLDQTKEQFKTQEIVLRVEHKIQGISKLYKTAKDRREQIIKLQNYLSAFPEVYISKLISKYERQSYNENLQELEKKVYELDKQLLKREQREEVFNTMKTIINLNYPGILESFPYYLEYYLANNLTYPSMLDWQTNVVLQYTRKDIETRSKCYPVQASGAEFFRQWIIEIFHRIPRVLKNKFLIVNLIHDQIIVEADKDAQIMVGEYLIKSAKNACRKVGIIPETLHIPEIKTIYPNFP